MSRARALLAEHWPLKLVSVVFAMGLWLFVAAEDRGDAVYTVPLDLVDRPDGVEVTSLGIETVIVRVEGRRSRLRTLREDDFRAGLAERGDQRLQILARYGQRDPAQTIVPAEFQQHDRGRRHYQERS